MADKKYEGSCLCGEVRFEVDGAFESFFLCHCQRCRKRTGSAYAANLFSTTATLNWLQGDAKVRTFGVPETRHSGAFCSVCGSSLPTVRGERIKVPAGCLDSDIAIQPNAHIFMGSKACWDDALEKVEQHERYQDS